MYTDSEKSEQTPIRCKACGNKLQCSSYKVRFYNILGERREIWASHCMCETCAIQYRAVYSSFSRRDAVRMAKENGRYHNDV